MRLPAEACAPLARLLLGAAALLGFAFPAPPASTAPKPSKPYTCIALGTLGGDWSEARGVNDAGEVVGLSTFVSGRLIGTDERAFYWKDLDADSISDPGEMRLLGTLVPNGNSVANKINGAGQIVGWASLGPGTTSHAVLWTVSGATVTLIDLNDLLPETAGDWVLNNALDVNAGGMVAGTASVPAGDGSLLERGYLLELASGAFTLIDPLPGRAASQASALNNLPSPQVIGYASDPAAAFLVSGGALFDLSPLTGASSINDAGGVATWINGHPAYWRDADGDGQVDSSDLVDLGTFGAETTRGGARDVNSAGLVVGNTGRREGSYTLQRAFRWQAGTASSSKQDLNDLTAAPFKLRRAWEVTDGGLIAGYGSRTGILFDPSSVDQAFLLKPNP